MGRKTSLFTISAIGVLSLAAIIVMTAHESFSAQAPTDSPFGRLTPMAPVGPVGPAAPAVAIPQAAPVAAPAPRPATAAAAAPARAAAAQASAAATPRILVIDRNMIMQRSAAGKEMVSQTQALYQQAENQFRNEETQLQSEATQLQQQLAILAADVRDQKQKEFLDKQKAFQTRVQQRQAEIQAGFNKAAQQLETALEPILQGIMRERGANMVLDRSAVMIAAVDIDITSVAVQRLDKALPHIKVELTKPPAGATAAAARGGR